MENDVGIGRRERERGGGEGSAHPPVCLLLVLSIPTMAWLGEGEREERRGREYG